MIGLEVIAVILATEAEPEKPRVQPADPGVERSYDACAEERAPLSIPFFLRGPFDGAKDGEADERDSTKRRRPAFLGFV